MKLIKYTTNIPEENIALDELMLLRAEKGREGEILRFWESSDYFIVLGRAGKNREECLLDACRKDNIKIIRRISGGGTVLQGKGCLNYSLVLSYLNGESKNDIKSSYLRVLNNIADTFKKEGISLEVLPISDMALGSKKVSGNAQARKKNYFLHHGTFLYDMDLSKIAKYLKHPPSEPDYRLGRTHSDFVANLPLAREKIEELILRAMPIDGIIELDEEALVQLRSLVKEKYSQNEWNFQF